MNICFANTNYSMGGVQKVIVDVANELDRSHNVSLFSFSNELIHYEVNTGIRIETAKKSYFTRLKKKMIKDISVKVNGRFDVLKYYEEEVEELAECVKKQKIDVVIVSQGALTALIPDLKRRLPSVRFIAWQHSEANAYFEKYTKNFLKEYKKGLESAHKVICLTKADLEVFQRYSNNVTQIYNPVVFPKGKITNLENHTICFAGRILYESKGLDVILEALTKIDRNWILRIAGMGSSKEMKKLKRSIVKYNLTDRVVIVGKLKTKELADFYSSSDIYVSASKWEGFGLTIVEAMACGLPIIAYKNSGPSEILGNGDFGILTEKKVDELAENINNLIVDKNKMQKLQKKSILRSKDFSIDKILPLWEEVLEDER